MNIFKKTQENEKKFNSLIEKLDNINSKIQTYSKDIDVSSITTIKESFKVKIDDFFRDDRKLNIGVIGQVKAGKSSFLNTLIFDGQKVLPTAATPKTATLTKIEYSDKNFIEIEYYTNEEWGVLEEKSKIDSSLNEYLVAKEIMTMVKENNIDVVSYLDRGVEAIEFASYDNLMNDLNNFVGENGKLTPLVKSVKIGINKEDLKEISIVDTPGLNDPIASRTDKTKQFIEMCDVVFFLSRASQFLDKSDVELLTSQLPQKGVKKLVFICSRYDDGLQDTIYDSDSLEEADVETKVKLKRHASKTFEKVIKDLITRNSKPELIKIIEECKEPFFISSMSYNMSKKAEEDFDEEEELVFNNLNENSELNADMLRKIGNIDKIKEIYYEVIENKEDTLVKKADSFIPEALNQVKEQLKITKDTMKKRMDLLSNNDKEELLKQKKYIGTQINKISADLESVFGELNVKLEHSKGEALNDLRNVSKDYSSISERTGTETKTRSYTVSTSTWYKPWTWGASTTEYYTYDEHYQYLDVCDALENLRNFANDSANSIEETFYKAIDIKGLKRKLLNIIIENFDASDENYDPTYFKLLAEKTLNNIEMPIIKIDVSDFLKNISSKFSGEIRNSSERANLKSILADSISKLFENIADKFILELKKFKQELEPIKVGFSDTLLKNINDEFNIVLEQVEDKETQINKGNEFIEVIENIVNEI
jgi:hypothetical protein